VGEGGSGGALVHVGGVRPAVGWMRGDGVASGAMGKRGGRAWVLDADVWGPGLAAPGWLRGTVHGTGFRHPCRNDGLRDPRRPAGQRRRVCSFSVVLTIALATAEWGENSL
jgi:hypothetical protein